MRAGIGLRIEGLEKIVSGKGLVAASSNISRNGAPQDANCVASHKQFCCDIAPLPHFPRLSLRTPGDPEKPPPSRMIIVNHQHAIDLLMLAQIWPYLGHITVVTIRRLLKLGKLR